MVLLVEHNEIKGQQEKKSDFRIKKSGCSAAERLESRIQYWSQLSFAMAMLDLRRIFLLINMLRYNIFLSQTFLIDLAIYKQFNELIKEFIQVQVKNHAY